MDIGSFIEKIIVIGIGVYCVYLSYCKKEKLGNKATVVKICGIVLVVVTILQLLIQVFAPR